MHENIYMHNSYESGISWFDSSAHFGIFAGKKKKSVKVAMTAKGNKRAFS